jgi:deoxyribose-phosphate aldolase
MAGQIREHFELTGHRVGLKPAGGVRTADDALRWVALVAEELGDAWLEPARFRIGASALLDELRGELAAQPR